MKKFYILISIVAKALSLINKFLSLREIFRISPIIFLYAGVLILNTLYIQLIGSGIGIYSGLFLFSILICEISLFFIPSFLVMKYLIFNQLSINTNNYKSFKLSVRGHLGWCLVSIEGLFY